MLNEYDIEALRRSAAVAPLAQDVTLEIVEECKRLLRERELISVVLAELPASFIEVRTALGDLRQLVRA